MRLIHLANFGSTNVGNGALISGAERVLREDLGPQVQFTPEPWDDYTFDIRKFDSQFVDMVNQADGLIVGSAVTINARPYLGNAGMRVNLPFELWSRFTKPVIFYAISYRVWPYQRFYHSDKFRQAMDYILNNPQFMFSVRNDGTKGWLEKFLGYGSDKIVAIPDPALYVETKDYWHPELADGKINMLLSINNEDEWYRFGGKSRELTSRLLAPWVEEKKLLGLSRYYQDWQKRRSEFLNELVQAIVLLSQKWDLNLVLCPHHFDDYKTIAEFSSLLPPRLAHQITVSTGLAKVPRTSYFYDLYSKADVALSMRIHSMSPSIGLGTPTLTLSSQSRMTDFMMDAGLQDYLVDIFDAGLRIKVYERVNYLLENRDRVKRHLQAVRATMRNRTLAYNKQVSSLLQAA